MFLVSALPHVFSNGYQIRFSEIPNPDCAIGYIVPEWVSTKPSYSDIQAIYGSGKALPNTLIILPLKPEKVEAVKKQLSEIHPEVLLFLNKIKRLSIQESSGEICIADSISAVSISTETNLVSLNKDSGSRLPCSQSFSSGGSKHDCENMPLLCIETSFPCKT